MKGLIALQSIGVDHLDVQPSNVKVSETGEISLIDVHCYDPTKCSGFNRMLSDLSYRAILSPQLVKPYVQKNQKAHIEPEKTDCFSFGLVILCCSIVCDFREFYDFTYGNFLADRLNQALGKMSQMGYSQFLVRTVQAMLNTDENQRPSFRELLGLLSPQN